MKVPHFFVVLGRIARYYPQALIWFVVGMVSFHAILRVFGVSWYDILTTWGYFFSGMIGAHIAGKLMERRRARRKAIEEEWEAAWNEEYTRTKK